ncbi:MAG: CBS domain-containing protein [Aeromicrobium sp.]
MTTVADAMLRFPKLCDAGTTAGQLRELFADDHVYAAPIIDDGRLLAVVYHADLGEAPDVQPASELGSLEGRTVSPDAELEPIPQAMVSANIRRLAVIDQNATLLGMLCLKRTGDGFCSDAGVAARAAERLASVPIGNQI